MINLAGSVTRGVIKPLCVAFNVHNVVYEKHSRLRKVGAFMAEPGLAQLEAGCKYICWHRVIMNHIHFV